MTPDDFRRALDTHLFGAINVANAVLPGMRERKNGSIVFISSVGGLIGVPHLLPYTASKFALVGLSEGMRAELAKDGIRVTTVVPGLMRTGSPPNAMFKGRHRDEYAWFALSSSLPLTSMRAERAAARIIDAMRHGDPEVVLSLQAKLAVKLNALAPKLAQRVAGLASRLLPAPGGVGAERVAGRDSDSPVTTSVLTRTTARAARRNNEVP
jgi:NAD(P)-dependent dehydrogenase (short-subunit alcohol dehydrogenase family)